MVVQPDLEVELRAFFARRGVAMPESNVKQATLIASASILPNPVGTAPGWWVERDGHVIVAMPGVPGEMFRMWREEVVPRLQQRQGGTVILTRTFKVIGVGESAVEELIKPLLAQTNPTIATYAKADGVHVRTSAKAAERRRGEPLARHDRAACAGGARPGHLRAERGVPCRCGCGPAGTRRSHSGNGRGIHRWPGGE